MTVLSSTTPFARRHVPAWEGWHLLGAYPEGDLDDVGSWLLHHNGEAALLEVPPGLTTQDVLRGLRAVKCRLKYITASHDHEDHLDEDAWDRIICRFPGVRPLDPRRGWGDMCLGLGAEPLYLIHAPKHSNTDQVVVFRGVAMTGDIELGTLGAVNDEVTPFQRQLSFIWLAKFQQRQDYRVHSVISAHLNDVRTGVDWERLFQV